ncbi:MAG: penicillin acylase family protein [Phycisphaerales bacterium JB043]
MPSDPDQQGRSRKRGLKRLARRATISSLFAVLVLMLTASCVTRPPALNSIDGVQRLALLDTSWPALSDPVTITWDTHLIPSISAQNDLDAAFAIGLVHAHLRYAQMDILRHVSQARISEMVGPFGRSIDGAIRAIDLDRAIDEMERALPDETRNWLTSYVAGVNAYIDRNPRRPSDARTLGFDYDEAWSVRDVLAVGRLLSVDVNWGRYFSLASLRDETGFDGFARRLWQHADEGIPSFGPEQPTDLSLLTDIGRTGSNALVVAGDRSISGGALVASDPHLGLPQPNIWCVLGYRTPENAVVGLTIPGVPFVLVGRNESIAWTGTNMQSSSTVLYELQDGWEETDARTEIIRVRWWFDRERTIRESQWGPVITDARLFGDMFPRDVAMRWRGHAPSDESSAFLKASSATTWDEFREAFRSYAVGGQNMLFGDANGNIGQIMAIEAIPAAAQASRIGVVGSDDSRFDWSEGIASPDLPYSYNPSDGFLASANNVPIRMSPALIPQGNSNDRIERMREIMQELPKYSLDDLEPVQRDTYSKASHALASALVEKASTLELDEKEQQVSEQLAAWDGRYDRHSVGAVVYQKVLSELLETLYIDTYSDAIVNTMRSASYVHDFVRADVERSSPEIIKTALRNASSRSRTPKTWGDVHTLRLAHPIGMVPYLGKPYNFKSLPQDGSTTTLYKAAHPVNGKNHTTNFGACARLLCDMGTLDDNRVVLLGGQDGWMGSDRLLDQADIWQRGGYVPLPITAEGQQQRSVLEMTLTPAD